MSDEFDVSTLLDTDDQLSFRRPGIGLDVTHKLRAGQWSIQRQLDLHGLRVDEAREALGQFIRLSHRTGIRCVRVVHGKGLGSPGKTPCSRAACCAGWCRKRKCWPLCRPARPKVARAPWSSCCSRASASCTEGVDGVSGDGAQAAATAAALRARPMTSAITAATRQARPAAYSAGV